MKAAPDDNPSMPSSETCAAPTGAVQRVAFVVPKLTRGGAEQVIVLLAKTLVARGIPSQCVCLECRGTLGDELAREGVPVISLDSRRGYDVKAIVHLARALRRFNPSVINIHDRSSLPYAVLANMLGVHRPIIFSAHGFLFRDFDRPRWKYRIAAKGLAAFTAESDGVAARYAEHLGWRGAIDRVPNGVPVCDINAATRLRVRQAGGISTDTFVFISVGNAKPEKGFEDLLEAAALLRRQGTGRPLECWIVGAPVESQYQAGLLARHAELGLEKHVKFLGFQPDIQSLYQAADALLLPSRSEGLPMVLLEAMMVGLPTVATRVGAIPDVVTQQTGLLVDARAPQELAHAMARLVADPNLCRTFGDSARQRALTEYSVHTMASRYVEVFERAVARNAPSNR